MLHLSRYADIEPLSEVKAVQRREPVPPLNLPPGTGRGLAGTSDIPSDKLMLPSRSLPLISCLIFKALLTFQYLFEDK
jgi:hypothetical protein